MLPRLIRRLFILVALVLQASLASAGYEAGFAATRAAAWALYVRTGGGLQAVCSATAVATDQTATMLLTAGHCFLGKDTEKTDFLVTQDHRTFYKAHLGRSGLTLRKGGNETSTDLDDYRGNDWALVTADVGRQAILPIGRSTTLHVGEDLLIVGVPFGLDFLAVQGIVGSTDVSLSSFVWNHYYGANIFVAGGNSGSGVVRASTGEVVGIVNAGPGPQSSMMLFMPSDRLPVGLLTDVPAATIPNAP